MPAKPRIAYCGPIARPGEPARGGYESANRRLIDDLRARGVAVKEYPYAPERTTAAGKAVAYATNFAATAARVLADAAQWDILHITPLRRHFILPEAVICMNAKARGRPIVVDIRAGNFIRDMSESGRVQIAVQSHLLRHADLVTVEGLEYVDFTSRFTRAPVHYLPNYVSDTATPLGGLRIQDPVRLVFLARIVEEKGIETAIDALTALVGQGIDARLEVLGRGVPSYMAKLRDATRGLPVDWRGAVNAHEVRPAIRGAHFFVFPTRHDGEGHSNALTEAMAEGLVPLCADNGFNRGVVADCGRIFGIDAAGSDYADAVRDIVGTGQWMGLSQKARERVDAAYTAEAVVPRLIDQYARIVPTRRGRLTA